MWMRLSPLRRLTGLLLKQDFQFGSQSKTHLYAGTRDTHEHKWLRKAENKGAAKVNRQMETIRKQWSVKWRLDLHV